MGRGPRSMPCRTGVKVIFPLWGSVQSKYLLQTRRYVGMLTYLQQQACIKYRNRKESNFIKINPGHFKANLLFGPDPEPHTYVRR